MNTNQVMPMAGGVQVSRKAPVMAVRDRAATQGKSDSFNDVLAKSKHNGSKEDSLTLQDVKDLAKSAEAAEKQAELAETVKSAGTEAETPKITKNEETADSKTVVDLSEAVEDVESGDVDLDIDMDIDAIEAVVNPLSAVVASRDIENNFVDGAGEGQREIELVSREVQSYNLQTILPQSGEMSAKHTEMLQMLSGQLIPKNQESNQLNGLNLNDVRLAKAITDTKIEAGSEQNANLPQFVQKMPTDPLSAMTSDMAKFKNVDVNASTDVAANLNLDESAVSDVKANVNVGNNVRLEVGVNVNSEEKPIAVAGNLPNVSQEVVVDGKVVLSDKPEAVAVAFEDAKAEVINETKVDATQPKAEATELKTVPLAASVVVSEKVAPQTQGNNPLAGVTIEVEDGEIVSEPRFANFEQSSENGSDNERQPLFDERKNDIFRMTEGSGNNPNEGQRQIEPQTFASHVESQNNTNSTQNTRESTPLPQAPRDDFNVRGQIVEQARLIRQESGTEMVIRLKPEHLGNLTLRISVSSEGAVTASFFTNNHEVRNIVESSLVQLRQELQNQGLKVDKTEVYSGLSDGSLPQGQGQEAWQQNGRGSSRGGFRNAENDALAFEEVSTSTTEQGANVGAADGVDYLV